jgi:c-di-GMP-binding flagellar brake protein YcgR
VAAIIHDERRKHTRVGFTTDITILLEANGQQVKLKGSSKDLSLKGIFVKAEKWFEPQTQCVLKIYLSGGITEIELVIKSTIVRKTDVGMGIEFDSMDVDTYSHLKNIVYYNSIDDSV